MPSVPPPMGVNVRTATVPDRASILRLVEVAFSDEGRDGQEEVDIVVDTWRRPRPDLLPNLIGTPLMGVPCQRSARAYPRLIQSGAVHRALRPMRLDLHPRCAGAVTVPAWYGDTDARVVHRRSGTRA